MEVVNQDSFSTERWNREQNEDEEFQTRLRNICLMGLGSKPGVPHWRAMLKRPSVVDYAKAYFGLAGGDKSCIIHRY